MGSRARDTEPFLRRSQARKRNGPRRRPGNKSAPDADQGAGNSSLDDDVTTSLALTEEAAPTVDTAKELSEVKAMAAKISAARRLARKLAEERDSRTAAGVSDDEGVQLVRHIPPPPPSTSHCVPTPCPLRALPLIIPSVSRLPSAEGLCVPASLRIQASECQRVVTKGCE